MSEKDRGFTVTDRRTVAGHSDEKQDERAEEQPPAEPSSGSADEPRGAAEIEFGTFAMSIAHSALMHLGELNMPGEQPEPKNLPLAKQTIDILGMLQDKTRGNLSAEEARLLEHLLYDLRLKFVDAKKKG